jgi:hypothetical protein
MRDPHSVHAQARFLSKVTAKGIIIRRISGGQPARSYFMRTDRTGAWIGQWKVMPVEDGGPWLPATAEEAETVSFFARRMDR